MVKNLPVNVQRCWRCRFNSWVRNIPWRRKWQPIPVFLLGRLSTHVQYFFIINQQNHSHTSWYSMLWHMPFTNKLSPLSQNRYNSAAWGTIFLFLGRKLFLWVVWTILKEKQQKYMVHYSYRSCRIWDTRAPRWEICKSVLQVSLGGLTTSIGWLRCGLKRGSGLLRCLGPGPF